MNRQIGRRARRTAGALGLLALLFDVIVAVVWRSWCRDHGYEDDLRTAFGGARVLSRPELPDRQAVA